jgi:hypothetical protein
MERDFGGRMPLSRSDITSRYQIREGRIQDVGPFHAQMLYVPYFWEAYLRGEAHDVSEDAIVLFGVHSEDLREFPELANRSVVRLKQEGPRVVEA